MAEKIVIAHRGASGYLPEHTLAAKAAAHAMGADYLEQDVVLSKDGVPMVLHDIQIDTVTDVAQVFPDRARADGRFYAIDFTLDELKALTVMERADERGRAGLSRPLPARRVELSDPDARRGDRADPGHEPQHRPRGRHLSRDQGARLASRRGPGHLGGRARRARRLRLRRSGRPGLSAVLRLERDPAHPRASSAGAAS